MVHFRSSSSDFPCPHPPRVPRTASGVGHVALLSWMEPPRSLPTASSVCITAPSAHFHYDVFPSYTCSFSSMWMLTRIYLCGSSLAAHRISTVSVIDGVMLFYSCVRGRVVVDRVITRLRSLVFGEPVYNHCFVGHLLFIGGTVLLLFVPHLCDSCWIMFDPLFFIISGPQLTPLGVGWSLPSFTSFTLNILWRSYGGLIDLFCQLSRWVWQLTVLCFNTTVVLYNLHDIYFDIYVVNHLNTILASANCLFHDRDLEVGDISWYPVPRGSWSWLSTNNVLLMSAIFCSSAQ